MNPVTIKSSKRKALVILGLVFWLGSLAACGDLEATPAANLSSPTTTAATASSSPTVAATTSLPTTTEATTSSPVETKTPSQVATETVSTTLASKPTVANPTPKVTAVAAGSKPEIQFSRPEYIYGENMTLTGNNFPAKAQITIQVATPGSRTFVEFAKVTSDAQGKFSTVLKLDKYPDGRPLAYGDVKFLVFAGDTAGTAGQVVLKPAAQTKLDPCLLLTKLDAGAALPPPYTPGEPKFDEQAAPSNSYLTSRCVYVAGTSGTNFVALTVYQANPNAPEKWQAIYKNFWQQDLRKGLDGKPLNGIQNVDLSAYSSVLYAPSEAFWAGGELYLLKHDVIYVVQINQAGPVELARAKDIAITTISPRIP